ncbi:hypothetical protein EVA_15636 [gut metagenome]|uniref:Uncharacterized protein n=1 Tax=gut metagenome TaxID=749906 RepID=J9G370_9ZZZZ
MPGWPLSSRQYPDDAGSLEGSGSHMPFWWTHSQPAFQ